MKVLFPEPVIPMRAITMSSWVRFVGILVPEVVGEVGFGEVGAVVLVGVGALSVGEVGMGAVEEVGVVIVVGCSWGLVDLVVGSLMVRLVRNERDGVYRE